MSLDLSAAALVLFSAILHATWNALTKSSGDRVVTLAGVMGTCALIGGVASLFLPTPEPAALPYPRDLLRVPLRSTSSSCWARTGTATSRSCTRSRAASRRCWSRCSRRGSRARCRGPCRRRDRARVGRDGELRVRAARAAPRRRALGRVGVRDGRDDRLLHVPRRRGRAPRGRADELRRVELLGDEPRLLRLRARLHPRPARAVLRGRRLARGRRRRARDRRLRDRPLGDVARRDGERGRAARDQRRVRGADRHAPAGRGLRRAAGRQRRSASPPACCCSRSARPSGLRAPAPARPAARARSACARARSADSMLSPAKLAGSIGSSTRTRIGWRPCSR